MRQGTRADGGHLIFQPIFFEALNARKYGFKNACDKHLALVFRLFAQGIRQVDVRVTI